MRMTSLCVLVVSIAVGTSIARSDRQQLLSVIQLPTDETIGVIFLPRGDPAIGESLLDLLVGREDLNGARPVCIFDINGKLVFQKSEDELSQDQVRWPGQGFQSSPMRPGFYFYRFQPKPPHFRNNSHRADTLRVFIDSTAQMLPVYFTPDWDVTMGDLTGDGKDDYIVLINEGKGGDQPRLFVNDGAGHYADQTSSRLPPVQLFSTKALFIDVDNDSDSDIYLVASDNDSMSQGIPADQLWLNNGTGHFTDITGSHLPPNRGLVLNATSGYFNSDSLVDIVLYGTQDFQTPSLRLLYNTGMGVYADSTSGHLPPDTVHFGLAVSAFDATGDQKDDILLVGTFGGQNGLEFYRNTGSGFSKEDFRFPSVSFSFRGALTQDLNGDGFNDVFLFGIFGQPNGLLMNNGNGHFVDESSSRLPAYPSAHTNLGTTLDVERDGDKDIFLPTVQPGADFYDRLLINNGSGFFSDGSNLLPNNLDFSVSSSASVINNDSWHDILVANNIGQSGNPPQQDRLYINAQVITTVEEPSALFTFSLAQNYPNPFNPSTSIPFTIPASPTGGPHSSFVILKVFDILGCEVTTLVNEQKEPGNYSITFDANKLSSGVYFYRIQTEGFVESRKLLLLR